MSLSLPSTDLPSPTVSARKITLCFFSYHAYIAVFERLFAPGYNSSVRVVTINRRNYPGSTPYTAAEVDILNNGSDEQKTTFLNAQGNHLTTFIDKFIQQNHLPAISTDGKQGGIAVLGWSLGNTLSLASISNLDSAPADVQARFTKYLRSIIMLGKSILNIPSLTPRQSEPNTCTASQNPLPSRLAFPPRLRPGLPHRTQPSLLSCK